VCTLGCQFDPRHNSLFADLGRYEHCSETLYDKTLNKPYEVPQVFILQDFSVLRWDNKKVDLSVVTSTPEAIEATGKATAYIYASALPTRSVCKS
jgi:hypothetical protein